MRFLFVGIIVFITFILETTVFQYFRIMNIKPDFLLLILTSYSLMHGSAYGATIGFFYGMLVDIFFGRALGITALVYMITGFVIGKWHDRIFIDSTSTIIIFNLMAVLLYQNLMYGVLFLTEVTVSYIYFLINIVLPQVLLNVVIGILIHKILLKVDNLEIMEKQFL